MRKVLFWILIAILLFLLVVLGVSFWTNRKPLNVLKDWFGVQQNVVEVQEIEQNTGDDAAKSQRDIIRERLEAQREAQEAAQKTQDNTSTEPTTPTESEPVEAQPAATTTQPSPQTSAQRENKAAEDFVNNLIIQ